MHHRALPVHVPVALLSSLALVGVASAAQTYDFVISSKASSVDTSFVLAAPLAGTFIGTYDATTNPGGTKTLPGLFGGSTNTAIPYSATISAENESSTPPAGGFSVDVDAGALTVAFSGLSLDLLGGNPLGIGVVFTINYASFHTTAPSAIFPGGFDIPIPFGDTVVIESLVAVQTGSGVGTLVPVSPGVYTLNAVVPVDITAIATVLGQPAGDGTPFPAVLPIVGTLDLTGVPTIELSGSTTTDEKVTVDLPPFENLPLDLPTVLPPGGTASVLFSGALSSFALSVDASTLLIAEGSLGCVAADLNCDGTVDGADLGALLAAWGTPGPGDLNNDGVVDGADLGELLSQWGSSGD